MSYSRRIKDLQIFDKPREKLSRYGVEKLTDHELLALILGSGVKNHNVLDISKKVLKLDLNKLTVSSVSKIKGIGLAKASQIVAIFELSKRLNNSKRILLNNPTTIWELCHDFRSSKKENLVVFYLNSRTQLISKETISIGILNSSLIHPREVFEPAIRLSAHSIILAHNHPSNVLEPSIEDIQITNKLIEASKLMGIELLDHLIVSTVGWYSFKQNSRL